MLYRGVLTNCRWLLITLLPSYLFLHATPALAQSDQGWNLELAGGVAPTTGDISDRLTKGWNINLGGGYEINRRFEIEGNFAFNRLGVADQVLRTLDVPDGRARMMSLTAGPKVHFPIASKMNGYVMGGVGWYRRTVEFMEPTVGVIDIIDPWWGYVGSAIVPANQIIGSVSDNAWGLNGGGGVSYGLGQSDAEVFAEVRYHYAHTTPTTTSIAPVAFGVRFSKLRR